MSKAKAIGTAFETGFTRYWQAVTGDDRVHRIALHGSKDMGDVGGIYSHGCEGIAECKSHKQVTPALLEKWKRETENERENAGVDFALLVVHQPGKDATGKNVGRFGLNRCFVQLKDLPCLCLSMLTIDKQTPEAAESLDTWIEMSLADVASLVMCGMEDVI